MEQTRAHEAEIAGDDALGHIVAKQRIQDKERVLESDEAKSRRDHVDQGVDRLVIFHTMQAAKVASEKFRHFLQGGPEQDLKKDESWEKVLHSFLKWDDDDDGEHAEAERFEDETIGFRILLVFTQPEEEPDQGRENATKKRVENRSDVHTKLLAKVEPSEASKPQKLWKLAIPARSPQSQTA